MPTGKRDPYWNDPEGRKEHLKEVDEIIKKHRKSQWYCWCGNEAEYNPYTMFDADGWTGVMVCSVCGRNMQRRKDE